MVEEGLQVRRLKGGVRPSGSWVFPVVFHFCDFSHVFFSKKKLFFLDFLFSFFLIFLFFLKKYSLNSGRSKVTRIMVGRDTDRPKFSSL